LLIAYGRWMTHVPERAARLGHYHLHSVAGFYFIHSWHFVCFGGRTTPRRRRNRPNRNLGSAGVPMPRMQRFTCCQAPRRASPLARKGSDSNATRERRLSQVARRDWLDDAKGGSDPPLRRL